MILYMGLRSPCNWVFYRDLDADNFRVRVLSNDQKEIMLQALHHLSGGYLHSQKALLIFPVLKATEQALRNIVENNSDLLWSTSGTAVGFGLSTKFPSDYRAIPEAVLTTLFGMIGNQIPLTSGRLDPFWPRVHENLRSNLTNYTPEGSEPFLNLGLGSEQTLTGLVIQAVMKVMLENASQTSLDLTTPGRIRDIVQWTTSGTALGTQLGVVLPYLGSGVTRAVVTSFLATYGGQSFARMHDLYPHVIKLYL